MFGRRSSPIAIPLVASGPTALALVSVGALAVGALAIGALAIGAMAIGKLRIGRARFKSVEIDELIVRRLTVVDQVKPSVVPADPDTQPTDGEIKLA